MAEAGQFDRRRLAVVAYERAVEMCQDAQSSKRKPPFEAIENSLEDLLRELKHVRIDVLGLKGHFIDSDVVYSSDEEDNVPAKIKRRRKAQKRKSSEHESQSESQVNRFSNILLKTQAGNPAFL